MRPVYWGQVQSACIPPPFHRGFGDQAAVDGQELAKPFGPGGTCPSPDKVSVPYFKVGAGLGM